MFLNYRNIYFKYNRYVSKTYNDMDVWNEIRKFNSLNDLELVFFPWP